MGDRVNRYVIIGNGAAGTFCAETLKKQEPTASVTLIANEPYPLYNRVALPPFLRGQVQERKVIMRTPERHRDAGIDFRTGVNVVALCVEERTVLTDTGEELPFDKLMLATGGRPNPLKVPGASWEHCYNFQTLDDTRAIIERVLESKAAITYGGSFIAYELTEGFATRGLPVTWIMRGPRFLRRILDEEGGELVDRIAAKHNVTVLHGDEVLSVHPKNGLASHVKTKQGRTIEGDLIGVGLGLTLNTDFLQGTPVTCNRGIVVDEYLETSVPGIFAGGDAAEFYDSFTGQYLTMGTWDNAVSHGRTAAANMLGDRKPYTEVPTYTSTLFHTKISVVGITPESSPDLVSVSRVDFENEQYLKIFFLQDRVVGAVMIGSRGARRTLLELIKSKEPVEGDKTRLLETE